MGYYGTAPCNPGGPLSLDTPMIAKIEKHGVVGWEIGGTRGHIC